MVSMAKSMESEPTLRRNEGASEENIVLLRSKTKRGADEMKSDGFKEVREENHIEANHTLRNTVALVAGIKLTKQDSGIPQGL